MSTRTKTSFNRNPSSLSSKAIAAFAFRGRHPNSLETPSTFLGTQPLDEVVHFRALTAPHVTFLFLA